MNQCGFGTQIAVAVEFNGRQLLWDWQYYYYYSFSLLQIHWCKNVFCLKRTARYQMLVAPVLGAHESGTNRYDSESEKV
jgi:hypothetical protein